MIDEVISSREDRTVVRVSHTGDIWIGFRTEFIRYLSPVTVHCTTNFFFRLVEYLVVNDLSLRYLTSNHGPSSVYHLLHPWSV